MGERLSKRERMAIFFDRLRCAAPPRDAESALALICRTMEEVEGQYCDEPRMENPGFHTERMCPPMADMIVRVDDGSILANSRRHLTTILRNGTFRIVERATGDTICMKESDTSR